MLYLVITKFKQTEELADKFRRNIKNNEDDKEMLINY